MTVPMRRSLVIGAVTVALGLTGAGFVGPNTALRAESSRTVGDAPVADIEAPVGDIEAPVEDIESETVEGESTTITITSDVLFEFDSATLTDAAKDHLETVADKLRGAAGAISVDGYTDSAGSSDYNQKLSEKRAEAVVDELKKNLPDAEFEATGHGEKDPVEENQKDGKDDPDAMAKNRRVTIEYS